MFHLRESKVAYAVPTYSQPPRINDPLVGGSILWVFSTVLLQMEVPDRFRGRVFAAELAFVTLITSLSSYCTAFALDRVGWSPRTLSFTLGVLFGIPGSLWLVIVSRWHELAPGKMEMPAAAAIGEEEVLEGRVG